MSASAIPNFTMTARGGGCSACGMPGRPGEEVLDTGIDVPFEGSIQFHASCIAYWWGLLGGMTPQLQEQANADLQRMATELTEAKKHLARLAEKEAKAEIERAELRKMLAYGRGEQGKQEAAERRAAKANA